MEKKKRENNKLCSKVAFRCRSFSGDQLQQKQDVLMYIPDIVSQKYTRIFTINIMSSLKGSQLGALCHRS